MTLREQDKRRINYLRLLDVPLPVVYGRTTDENLFA
jgi:hypothetical protein